MKLDEDINKKLKQSLQTVCFQSSVVVSHLKLMKLVKLLEFVGAQVSAALAGLTAEQVAASVIAYEPIWAIGTGKSASQDDAQKMCKVVRDVVAADFGQELQTKFVFNTVVLLNLKTLLHTWLAQTLTVPLLVVRHLKLKASWHCLTL